MNCFLVCLRCQSVFSMFFMEDPFPGHAAGVVKYSLSQLSPRPHFGVKKNNIYALSVVLAFFPKPPTLSREEKKNSVTWSV